MERIGNILAKQFSVTSVGPGLEDEPKDGSGREDCSRCGGLGWIGISLPIEHVNFGRALPCTCREETVQNRHIEKLQHYSNLGSLTRLTFKETVPDGIKSDAQSQERFRLALQKTQEYAQLPKGWLILSGPSGCGKTHLAASVVNYRIEQGAPALFMVVPDFLDHLRSSFSPDSALPYDELFETVRNSKLLILDDLGTQTGTPWAQEKLFQLLNHRYNAQLPTVVTSNVPLYTLDERLQTRLTDPSIASVYKMGADHGRDIIPENPLDLTGLREMTFQNFSIDPTLPVHQKESLRQAFHIAENYSRDPDGWLIFYGDHGGGKTHLAAAISHSLREHEKPVTFVFVPDFIDYLRRTFSPNATISYDRLFEEVRHAPLLVLDDLYGEAGSPWVQEKFFQILNYRYNARLPLIVTMALSLEDLQQQDARIASRLGDARFSTPIEISAPDHRTDRPPTRNHQGRWSHRTQR